MRGSHRISHVWLAAAVVAALGLLSGPVGAGETDDDAHVAVAQAHEEETDDAHEQAAEHGEEHAEHGEHHAKNAVSLFLGGTLETAVDKTYFTIGGEYERRLVDKWAFQMVVEYVNDFDALVVVVPLAFEPVKSLWLMTGPGFETARRRPGHGEDNGGHEPDSHGEEHTVEPFEEGTDAFFLWRFGVGYAFHFGGKYVVMPTLALDLVREDGEWVEAWVFGVSVGFHF